MIGKAANYGRARRAESPPQGDGQSGFVLPFVLVAIAGMALIASAAFSAVSRSAELMRAIDDDTALDAAFQTAEAQAVYTLLTAPPMADGVYVGDDTEAVRDAALSSFISGVSAAPLPASEVWSATGEARRVSWSGISVSVAFRDAAGLFPLVDARADLYAAFLKRLGLKTADAEIMGARASDYQDINNVRQFRGAERAQYRLYGARSAPTNSPLRAHEELGNVLGMVEAAPSGFWDRLQDLSTPFPGVIRQYAAPPALSGLMDRSPLDPVDPLTVASADDVNFSGRARFLLTAKTERGLRTRAVEIANAAAATDLPFRRYWIYDRTRPADANGPDIDELAELFDSGTAGFAD